MFHVHPATLKNAAVGLQSQAMLVFKPFSILAGFMNTADAGSASQTPTSSSSLPLHASLLWSNPAILPACVAEQMPCIAQSL